MQRVMIIGGPGSGKSTLARFIGKVVGLPVVHIDKIHWKPNWVERPADEKWEMIREVHARDAWVFEGNFNRSVPERAARAGTVIFLDLPFRLRMWRVIRRTLRDHGKLRGDELPDGCVERFDPEFFAYIWRTRQTGRLPGLALVENPPAHAVVHHLTSPAEVAAFQMDLERRFSLGQEAGDGSTASH